MELRILWKGQCQCGRGVREIQHKQFVVKIPRSEGALTTKKSLHLEQLMKFLQDWSLKQKQSGLWNKDGTQEEWYLIKGNTDETINWKRQTALQLFCFYN